MLRRNFGTISLISFLVLLPFIATFNFAFFIQVKQMVNKEVFYFVPYWTFGAAAFLGYRFNLTKMIFISCYFLFTYTIFRNSDSSPVTAHNLAMKTFVLASPLTLTLLYAIPMRRLITFEGALNLICTFLPLSLFSFGLKQWPAQTMSIYNWKIPSLQFGNLPTAFLPFMLIFFCAQYFTRDRYMRQLHTFAFAALIPVFYIFKSGMPDRFSLALGFIAAGSILLSGVIKMDWQKVYFDELTEIPNRRALNEALLQLGNRYTVAMIDIDHFKKFNDTYGHEEGDRVLRMVAQHIHRETSGLAYRYGGEEFTLLYNNKLPEDVVLEIDNIRNQLAYRTFYIRGKSRPDSISIFKLKELRKQKKSKGIKVTVSVGVSASGPNLTIEDVFKDADQKLYHAKESGRNRVISSFELKALKKTA